VDWIRLMPDKNKWRTLVSTVITLLIPHIKGNFLISCSPFSYVRTLLNGVADFTLQVICLGNGPAFFHKK